MGLLSTQRMNETHFFNFVAVIIARKEAKSKQVGNTNMISGVKMM
jgi:hypothetical protein